MDARKIEHVLDPNCPWYPLKKLRLPNVKWCEEQLCGWVEEPANTWSNLGYVAVGLLTAWIARGSRSRVLRFYGPAAVIVGLTSLVYHASNTFVLQILDFLGMYVFCFLLVMINRMRTGHWPAAFFGRYWALVLGTTVLTVAMDFAGLPIQGIVLLLIVGILVTEYLCRKAAPAPYSMRHFFLSLGFIAGAFVFSVLDHRRILCDPTNHLLQGHALWHLVASFSLLFSYLHHRQFEEQLLAHEAGATPRPQAGALPAA